MRAPAVALIALTAAACGRPLPVLPEYMIPEPAPAEIENVIFLIGDAGDARAERSPLLRRMNAEVEYWAGALARDSAVVVLFLGDNVYPEGMRMTERHFPQDSAALQSQVNLLAGPNARRYHAIGIFLAGNHDWGNARDTDGGLQRLRNQEEFLNRRRREGIDVSLRPAAGEPGPEVVDVGSQLRILLYDTAWWLLAQDTVPKRRMFYETQEAIRTTEGRMLMVAAHHPYKTAGAHGGFVPFWKTLGLRLLLTRSGAVMQDLSSIVYRELRRELDDAFREQPPLIFAGGHDHSLQVIAGDTLPSPRFDIVSGAGSKVTGIGHVEGMLYRAAAPGYMRVMIHHSGRVDLFVVNAPDENYLECGGSGAELEACVVERSRAFTTRFGMRLK